MNLQDFCAKDDLRTYLKSPFKCDLGVCATNGHIMVIVPDNGEFGLPEGAPMHFNISKPLSKAVKTEKGFLPSSASLPEPTVCEPCKGTGHVADVCPCCDRPYDSEDVCEECYGTGKGCQSVLVGTTPYNLEYIRQLAGLKDCVFWPVPELPARFEFDGGYGCLMPLRKIHDVHHATVEFAEAEEQSS